MIVGNSHSDFPPSGQNGTQRKEAEFLSIVMDGAAELRPIYAGEIGALKRRAARRRLLRRLGGTTVVCGLIAAFGFASYGWRSAETAVGMPRTLDLADGGRIHLDAGGAVELPIAPWRREAKLLRGDAVFDIRHDDVRPFVVAAGFTTVTDLGTRFLVQARPDSVAVAVFEGKVELAVAATPPLQLSAGGAALSTPSGILDTAMPDEAEITAWRQGRLVFRNTPLQTVAERLSRYRGETVMVEGAATAALKVSGTFRIDDTDGALRTLERAFPIRIDRQSGRTVIAPVMPRR
ncbi:MAG: FecR domain-containing protein [Magnetospirillum sp. WYHS-4]